MEAVGSVDQWKKAKAAEEMQRQHQLQQQAFQQMQMQSMQAQMQERAQQAEDAKALRGAATSAFITPEQAMGQSMGPMPDGSSVPQVQSGFNDQRYIQNLQQLGRPLEALQHQAAIQKDDAPVKLGQGDQLFSGRASGYKPLASVPAKPEATPAALQEYLFAVNQGEKRSYTEWSKDQKRSGANNTTVSIAGPENAYNKDIGTGLAKDSLDLVNAAKAAPEVVNNARMIKAALDRGAITGTGADTRLAVQKAAETMGIVQPGKAATTQELMAGLGKLTLSGIKTSGLGGGNGFTDKDREFLNAAISGTITDTPQNLRRVADLSERIATATHQKGSAVVSRWQNDPALKHVVQDTVIDPISPAQTPGKTVVKTGTYGGKRVVQYSDGTTDYAN